VELRIELLDIDLEFLLLKGSLKQDFQFFDSSLSEG